MGMYTGIEFKGYIKEEYRENFKEIALNGEWENSDFSIFREFGQLYRAGFIPCGGLCYMPDDWAEVRFYCPKKGYWHFTCSLKNYENEIEQFMEMIPYFVKKLDYFKYFYEEWSHSKLYGLVNGELMYIGDEKENGIYCNEEY